MLQRESHPCWSGFLEQPCLSLQTKEWPTTRESLKGRRQMRSSRTAISLARLAALVYSFYFPLEPPLSFDGHLRMMYLEVAVTTAQTPQARVNEQVAVQTLILAMSLRMREDPDNNLKSTSDQSWMLYSPALNSSTRTSDFLPVDNHLAFSTQVSFLSK